MPQTLEQCRAADALAKVQSLLGRDEDLRGKYRSYIERLGPAIVINGLGQALAFEKAAAGPNPTKADQLAHDQVYRNLQAWLCRPANGDDPGGPYAGQQDVLSAICARHEDAYLLAHAESLSWLSWHKKFCKASIARAEQD